MSRKPWVRVGAVLCAVVFVATSCGSDKKSSPTTVAPATTAASTTTSGGGATTTSGGGGGSTTTAGGGSDLSKIGLWDDGPCDDAKPKLTIGLQTVFASGVLTLQDQAQALDAAAKAFNARGGANGHCLVVHNCRVQGGGHPALRHQPWAG